MKKRRFVYALSAMLLLGTPLVGCNNNSEPSGPDKPIPTPFSPFMLRGYQ